MTFSEYLTQIPFNADRASASGLLAPIIRASGHILYAMAAFADPGYTIPDEEVRVELNHATAHLASTPETVEAAPISSACKTIINAFVLATEASVNEWNDWTADQKGQNLRDLANRAAAIGAFLDGELAGVPGSYPGSTV